MRASLLVLRLVSISAANRSCNAFLTNSLEQLETRDREANESTDSSAFEVDYWTYVKQHEESTYREFIPILLIVCLLSLIIFFTSFISLPPWALLKFESACIQVLRRRHILRLPLRIVEEQTNQACVYHPTIGDNLVLDELGESKPYFVYALHILFHDSLARTCCAHV